ncbi:TPA: hypothetical protein EYP66_15735 [Candidatus Poribacteria bacterium]|nr:hypothetical protein [Candidatus Poribacteria bacterium]
MTLEQERDYDTVRQLAEQIVALATSDEYEARRKRWRDVNALRKPDRPPVWCRPVGAWSELLSSDSLTCTDPLCRRIETAFRQHLIKEEIGDDSIIEPWWGVGAVFDQDTPDTWGVPIRHIPAPSSGGAWKFDPPLKSEEDFDRLTIPNYIYNEAKTQQALSQMSELLGDTMEVRLTCSPPLGAGLGGIAANLRGLDQLMYDMIDRPDLVHRLMNHLQEGVLQAQKTYEESGLLTLNNYGPMYCSDPPDGDLQQGHISLRHLWGHTESQEFQEVSPQMWEEFLLSYQIPILSQFWLTSYGCCENLTRKIDGVLKIPNLRIFVCSAWTDLEKVVDAVGDRYTIMWRQKATDVVFPDDMTSIQQHLEEGMRIAQGCYVQIVLRELQTLNGRPERLSDWAKVAKEVVTKFS